MFVVMCENTDGEPTVFAPFESADQAQKWIDTFNNGGDTCPNDHYWLEADTPIIPENGES